VKILLIYNPQAAHKRAKKILPQVESYLKKREIDYDLGLTEYSGHAVEIAKKANFKDYDGVVAAGGDGTLFEVVNGYFQNPSEKRIPLGVLPTGTGNAFAKDLDLDASHWMVAIEVIKLNKPRKVDVGVFQTQGIKYYFLNIMGLGFVADVGKTAHKLKLLGNVSYTLGVLYQTAFLKAHQMKIEIDGKVKEGENIFVEISNTRYTSNFLMAPKAEIDDGLLDVTLVKKLNRRRLLKCFPLIFTGDHIALEEVDQVKAKKIDIVTEVPMIITPDGELLGETPVQVECLHKAIEVFWK
jgi:YegS/Rv2252/BmrU family lipid kinase